MKKLVVIVSAIALALTFAVVPRAEAASYDVSLPYVEDVNDWGEGKVIVTVTCCGKDNAQLKVTSQGKRVKVRKHHPRVWTVVLKRSKTYKLSVRAKNGCWKSIKYGVC